VAGSDQQQSPRSPRSPRARARSRPCSPFWCFSQSSQIWLDEDEEVEEEKNGKREKEHEEEKQKKRKSEQALSSVIRCDQQTSQRAAVSFELDRDNQLFVVRQAAPASTRQS